MITDSGGLRQTLHTSLYTRTHKYWFNEKRESKIKKDLKLYSIVNIIMNRTNNA